jgi:GNAT superfamily N-acetyltransferase
MSESPLAESDEITRIVETSERYLWIEMMRRVPEDIARDNGVEVRDFSGAAGFTFKTVPHWTLNRVLDLGYQKPASQNQINDIVDFYQSRNLPVGVSLIPHAQPPEAVDWLLKKGFELQNVWAKMYRNNSPIKARQINLDIIELGKNEADDFARVMCEGFGMPIHCAPVFAAHSDIPANHVFGVIEGDRIIAVGVLTMVDGIGHLNSMTTLEAWRGRGIQGALFEHSINEGIKLGCKWFATETGLLPDQVNHSYNNMVRSGFRMAYERPNYVRQAVKQ